MKRIISLMLVVVMLLSLVACKDNGKDNNESTTTTEPISIDAEVLKADWKTGKLFFPNGNFVQFPCKVSELIEKSGFKIGNESALGDKVLAPKEEVTLNIVGEGVFFEVVARNTSKDPDVPYKDVNVIAYSFNNTSEGNRQIKFAGTLTPGATRKAVEEALGIPEGQKTEDTLYYYNGKHRSNRNVKLIVSFNSDDIVNSVSYEIVYK